MLLQTLVENAIKHGIANVPAGGLLRIRAAVQNGMLNLEVVRIHGPQRPQWRRMRESAYAMHVTD